MPIMLDISYFLLRVPSHAGLAKAGLTETIKEFGVNGAVIDHLSLSADLGVIQSCGCSKYVTPVTIHSD